MNNEPYREKALRRNIQSGRADAAGRGSIAAGEHRARHFNDLDILRGVAALCVVIFHCHTLGILDAVLPHGYLAVDFFFELSGFVISFAYRRLLASSMDFPDFVVRRLIRIYPIALAGIVLGTVVLVLQWLRNPSFNISPSGIGVAALFNVLLLPDPFGGGFVHQTLYPCDVVVWSLFFELAINITWAAGLWRASSGGLAALWACSAVWFATLALNHGDADMGVDWGTVWGASSRISLGFSTGLLLERLGLGLALKASCVSTPLLASALVLTFAMPILGAWKPFWDVLAAVAIFPMLIFCGASCSTPSRISRLFGDLSFPLYALHVPVLKSVKLFGMPLKGAFGDAGFAVICISATVLMSWGTSYAYEAPVRRWLTLRLSRRRKTPESSIPAA